MDKKKIVAAIIGVLVVIVIVHLALRKGKQKGYVFDKSSDINLEDVQKNLKNVKFDEDNVKDYFSKEIVNPYTIKFFKSINKRFKDVKSFDELYDKVHEYLLSVMSEQDAEKLFALFKKYMKYQVSLADQLKKWGNPKSTEDAIDFLHKLQEYRRTYFGKDIADGLWGADIKSKEYPVRRGAIVHDKDMYAAEKEKKLKELNIDMWGNEADSVEGYAKPYVRYQEALSIYEKDLSDMSPEEKKAKIHGFREKIFSTEVVKRLDDVDTQIEAEKQQEDDYARQESEISNNPNLKDEEKTDMIRKLQDSTFGGQADAFRRRLAIQKGLDEIKKKN